MSDEVIGERSEYSGREVVDVLDQMELYTSDDQKVGDVLEINPDFLIVSGGGLFDREMQLPRNVVAQTEGNRMYLTQTADQLKGMDWGASTSQSTTGQYDTGRQYEGGDTRRVQRVEEELQAQKVTRDAGEVQIRKDVVEETRTIDVPVTREEVHVERVPVSGQTADVNTAFQGETINVPIREEEVQVTKVPRVVEELEISKTATQDTKRVQDTVRKEQLHVDDEDLRRQQSESQRDLDRGDLNR